MSKELEAFERVWEDCSQLDLDYVSKHNLMDDLREIKQALNKLERLKKQEKLLELYRELSVIRNKIISLALSDADYGDMETIEMDIEKQIKELEKELENE